MSMISRVGVDLAKQVIKVHAVDAAGKVVTNRALARGKFIEWCVHLPAGCLVAMEASAGAHHWCRKLVALGLDARITPAQMVSPYRLQGKGGKNDANDAAAICEAASRPQMHFAAAKTIAQQGMLCVHRVREGFKEERTATINQIRGLLAEFGVVLLQSSAVLRERLTEVIEDASNDIAGMARWVIERAYQHWLEVDEHIKWCDQRIAAHNKDDEQVRRAAELKGIGPITASALVATVGDFKQFRNGAQFGAWLGLTPRQNSSGGKSSLGGITNKRGDVYLRMLLIQAAHSAVLSADKRSDPISQWALRLREKAGWQKAAVALANKNARILWAVLMGNRRFESSHVSVCPGTDHPRPIAAVAWHQPQRIENLIFPLQNRCRRTK